MYFVKRTSILWLLIWSKLATCELNRKIADPFDAFDQESGECWQYMGSHGRKHQFRHRHHPLTQAREYITFFL